MALTNLAITDIFWLVIGLLVLFFYLRFHKKFPKRAFFSIKFNSLFITIIIPLLLSFILLSLFKVITNTSLVGENYSFLTTIVTFIVIGPFFEEFFLRGVILGGAFFISSRLDSKIAGYFFVVVGFLLQLFVFVWIHGRTSLIANIFLVLAGILYSLIFIFSDKNLLPAFIAHSFANVLVVSGVFS